MVFYVYEKGSRARRVALDFLKNFSGFLSTDGYVAYSIFDDAEKHPEIVHIGCWTHVRRYQQSFVIKSSLTKGADLQMIA